MYNKRLLSKIKMGKSVKPNPYKKDIIVDPMGQWKYHGKNTRIPSSSITMKGVNYPVLGVANTGQKQMMQPGKEYNFPGADYVDEYPQIGKRGLTKAQGGGTIWVKNADDPRYKDYLIRQALYNYSNNPNFNLRSEAAMDLESAIMSNNFNDFNNTYYDNLLSSLNKDKPSGDLDEYDRVLYEKYIDQNVGPYGSKVNYQTLSNDQLHTDPDYRDTYFYLKDLEQSDDFFKNYPPTGWEKQTSYNPFPYGPRFSYTGPYSNATYVEPKTLFIEDNLDRQALKKVYPNLTDAEIDKWLSEQRKEPSFLTNIKRNGINYYANYDVWDNNTNTNKYIADPNKKTFIDANGDIGYLQEDVANRIETFSDYVPRWFKPETIYKVLPEPIKIGPPPTLENKLGPLRPSTYVPLEPLPEAPKYALEPYTDERLRLSIEPGKTKSKKHHGRLFGHDQKYSWHTYKPSKDLELRRKEVVRPIPALVQKLTGYDPKYFEGYENEEGDYIPGELEIANELGNKVEFRGAASLRDYMNQQKYAKEYEEYQKKLDEWDERYEQLKKKQAEGSSFKKGGAKKKYTSDIINSTNYLFAEHPLFKKKKQSKKRIYDPNAKYYQNGGIPYSNLPATYQSALQNFVYPNTIDDPERTGYNSVNSTISYDSQSPIENMDNDWWREHELFHDLQNQAGGMSTSGVVGQRPNPYVASDDALQGYYDRRDADVNRTIDSMIAENSELQFIPRNKLAEGSQPGFVGAEDLQYADPSTLEGEARQYEQYIREGNPSIFPKKQNGGIPYNYNEFVSNEPEGVENPIPFNPKRTENDPEDYDQFLKYSETAPENRRPDETYFYGDSDNYDHYGMWEALGKPKDFQQALEMNPDWQPDPYDGYYHGFSVNPNTGVFLKSGKPGFKPGDTTWMEVNQHYLSPRSNQSNLVFDTDLQRFRYIPKEKNGGQYNLGDEVDEATMRKLKKLGYTFKEI